jgi:DNA-binding MarR family transcriptional regulator
MELAQQLRNEIMGYFGAANDFSEQVAKKLKLSRTDMRCLDLIDRLGPISAGRLAEESGLTTGAVTFILDRLEEAGMVTRRRDTEDRRRVWVEIVPEAQERLQHLQAPVAEEMHQVALRFKADELATVRDFMRQAKEVFQHQVHGAMSEAMTEANKAMSEAMMEVNKAVNEAMHEVHRSVRGATHRERHGGQPGEHHGEHHGEHQGEPPEEESGGTAG